jgi:hypothetical protein
MVQQNPVSESANSAGLASIGKNTDNQTTVDSLEPSSDLYARDSVGAGSESREDVNVDVVKLFNDIDATTNLAGGAKANDAVAALPEVTFHDPEFVSASAVSGESKTDSKNEPDDRSDAVTDSQNDFSWEDVVMAGNFDAATPPAERPSTNVDASEFRMDSATTAEVQTLRTRDASPFGKRSVSNDTTTVSDRPAKPSDSASLTASSLSGRIPPPPPPPLMNGTAGAATESRELSDRESVGEKATSGAALEHAVREAEGAAKVNESAVRETETASRDADFLAEATEMRVESAPARTSLNSDSPALNHNGRRHIARRNH